MTDMALGYAERDPGAAIASGERTSGHTESHGPIHETTEREGRRGDEIHAQPTPILEPIHAMDVGEAHEPKSGEHQNADAAPEIAPVNADEKLVDENRRRREALGQRRVAAVVHFRRCCHHSATPADP